MSGCCCVLDDLDTQAEQSLHAIDAWNANKRGEPALVEAAIRELIVLKEAVVAGVDAVGV